MKKILYLILLFSLSRQLIGQTEEQKYTLTNSKTKQWLDFAYRQRKGSVKTNAFYLYTKKQDHCEKQKITIADSLTQKFIDSLKKVGFKNNFKLINQKDVFKVSIELASMTFHEIRDKDSAFKFIYNVTLTNLKSNNSQTVKDSICCRVEKERVIQAFKLNQYKISSINEVKGTSIIIVDIYSEGLYTSENSINVFAPTKWLYF
jgi:hypothetical protein